MSPKAISVAIITVTAAFVVAMTVLFPVKVLGYGLGLCLVRYFYTRK